MKKNLKNILFVLFGVLCLYLSLKNADFNDIKNNIVQINISWFILTLVIMFFSHYFRALRWKLLIEPLGFFPRTLMVFATVMIGYFINYGVPRLGEVVKCTLLSKKEKIPLDELVGTMVAERLIDVVTLLTLIFFTYIFEGENLMNFISQQQSANPTHGNSNAKYYILLGAFALFSLGFIFYKKIILVKFKDNKIIIKIEKIRINIINGLKTVFELPKKKLILFIIYSFAVWFCYLMAMYIGFKTLNSLSHLTFTNAMMVLTSSSLGMILPSPGGVGIVQFFMQKALTIYNITETLGFSYAWLVWISQFVLVMILGIILYIYTMITPDRKSEIYEPIK